MKISISIISILALISLVSFTTPEAGITWVNQTQHLGKIIKGKPVSVKFEFTNNSNKPMIVTRVKTSCGCTASEWPKEPVGVGETSSIKATYNAAVLGNFNKSITVYTDNGEQPYILYLKGEVVETE